MDLALYHPRFGYYARAAQRSGRAGDFFTNVDAGAVFGELLAQQIAEMAQVVGGGFDLVEAAAGNGRLARDILSALARQDPAVVTRTRLHLVEVSDAARAAQPATLGPLAAHLASSGPELPPAFTGVLVANELLDALPVHQAVWRNGELREVYVTVRGDGLVLDEDAPSTPRLAEYVERCRQAHGRRWRDGERFEVPLAAAAWLQAAAARLTRGFLLFVDYGDYGVYGDSGDSGHQGVGAGTTSTLTACRRHVSPERSAARGDRPDWLDAPGDQDLTARVDFAGLQLVATAAGLETLALIDQTYFLLALAAAAPSAFAGSTADADRRRRELKTLVLPGGLGSTMKVWLLARGLPGVSLIGSRGGRLT